MNNPENQTSKFQQKYQINMQAKEQFRTISLEEGLSLKYFSNTNQLNSYNKDIISGQYEGGFKLWDCTLDLAQFIVKHKHIFQGKRVLEIGCGHGLLGILAYQLGAKQVCLQDYNRDVIQKLTTQTVVLNCSSTQNFSFLFGDWAQLTCQTPKYDIILGSEVIYNQQTYPKLIHCLQTFMDSEGQSFLANKTMYFGVGGSSIAFKKEIQKTKLKYQSLEKITPQSGGNKKEIIKLNY